MQTIKEKARKYYNLIAKQSGNHDCAECAEAGFKAGVEFAQQWISVKDELPEIKTEPLQVIGKLRINGQYETYWVEYTTDQIEKECSHWRPIELK